jgi:hypothetical protein
VITVKPFGSLASLYSRGFGRGVADWKTSIARTDRRSRIIEEYHQPPIRRGLSNDKPGCERPTLNKGGEQGGREWILGMSLYDVRSKPEPNPKAHYQVRDQNEKGGFPIQKEHAGE